MVKFIVLISGVVGCVMGISLLIHQAGRGEGGDDDTFEVTRPCIDSHGEPC